MVLCSNEHCRPRASDLVRKSRRFSSQLKTIGVFCCVLFRFPCRNASIFNETSCKRYMFPIISGPDVLTFLFLKILFPVQTIIPPKKQIVAISSLLDCLKMRPQTSQGCVQGLGWISWSVLAAARSCRTEGA